MSCNRENVIWKSKNGTWNRAFYDFYDVGDPSDPDWDYEWDVEYTDDFNWASVGHATEEAAHRSWDGSNPGSYTLIEDPGDETDELDAKAAAFLKQERARPASVSFWLPTIR